MPPAKPLAVPQRIGVFGETTITLPEVIQRVLANDKDLAVARIALEEAGLNIKGAQGYFDPRIGLNAFRLESVTPIASLIGGGANGKLLQKELYADPQLSGSSPWLGTTYKLDYASARQYTDSTFTTLNPQFPASLNLSLTQPLWRGLRFDANRERIQVARRNRRLSDEQLRQRVIEVTTQAIQAYWELEYAYRSLTVQVEAVRLAEQQDASNRRQVDQGLLAPADVIQTQTQVATFEQNVFLAQEALTRAENNLKALVLANRDDLMWGVALLPDPALANSLDHAAAPPTLPDALKLALSARPELAESALNIEVNRLDTRLVGEQAKPQIDVVGTFSLNGLAGRTLPLGPNPFLSGFAPFLDRIGQLSTLAALPPIVLPPTTSSVPPVLVGGYGQSVSNLNGTYQTAQVGIQMSLPLRNRTANANLAISMLEGKRLQTQRDQLAMTIEADVRNTLQAAASTRARLDAAVLARRSAEDQYASEQRQFQAGTSSVFLVLQRQTELISARSREIRAQSDLGQALADLDRATARTIAVQGIQLAAH